MKKKKRERRFGIKEFLESKRGQEALEALLFQPTCTINGLISGYTGKDSKTVLPHEVTAKLDFRLVPNQKPKEICMKL
ncbi:MAG: peptidase dimerization domain-containing protein [Candidatus Bathyarchaeia archaeon]